MKSEPPFSGEAFEEQLRAAREAPLPRFADRLAIGFGARAEARLRAAMEETAGLERVLLRWLTAFGACAVLALVAAGAAGLHTADPAPPGPDFADAGTLHRPAPALGASRLTFSRIMSGPTFSLVLRRNLLLVMLAVFVCGGLTGGAAGWFLARRPPAPPPPQPERGRAPGHSPDFLADALCRQLEVTEQEREQIRTVFREVFADLRPVLAQRDAEVQSAFSRLRERITGMLNPEQQEKFTRIIEHVQNDPYHSKRDSPRE